MDAELNDQVNSVPMGKSGCPESGTASNCIFLLRSAAEPTENTFVVEVENEDDRSPELILILKVGILSMKAEMLVLADSLLKPVYLRTQITEQVTGLAEVEPLIPEMPETSMSMWPSPLAPSVLLMEVPETVQ